MNAIQIPCPVGQVSDGYHTFDELYDHRCLLFLSLMKLAPEVSWFSKYHHDETTMDGWFIAGMLLPTGDVSYHLPERLWIMACATGATHQPKAHKWDGHVSRDVCARLAMFVGWEKDCAAKRINA